MARKEIVKATIIMYKDYAHIPVWLIKCPYCDQVLKPYTLKDSDNVYLQCYNCGYSVKLSYNPPSWYCSR